MLEYYPDEKEEHERNTKRAESRLDQLYREKLNYLTIIMNFAEELIYSLFEKKESTSKKVKGNTTRISTPEIDFIKKEIVKMRLEDER